MCLRLSALQKTPQADPESHLGNKRTCTDCTAVKPHLLHFRGNALILCTYCAVSCFGPVLRFISWTNWGTPELNLITVSIYGQVPQGEETAGVFPAISSAPPCVFAVPAHSLRLSQDEFWVVPCVCWCFSPSLSSIFSLLVFQNLFAYLMSP